ncbi:MAG TPA: TolC family protein [Steroidobacteraceae bacterium]|nr:TolC family protein [Steroidobacteraceae bacterium]HRX90201.1 TolC family protein [Steroidobacteraceae bacterium]
MFENPRQLAAVLLVAACLPCVAVAQSFADLELRLRSHPALQAIDYQVDADRERAIAARALPDPVISVGVNNLPVRDPSFDTFLPTAKVIGVRQQIPSGAERDARSLAAVRRSAESQAMAEARFAELRRDLLLQLVEKQRIAQQRALLLQRDAKLLELVGVVEAEVDAGRPVVFRLAEVDAERAEVARLLIDLAGQEAGLDARLIELVGEVPAPLPALSTSLLASRQWSGDATEFHTVRIGNAATGVADAGVDQAAAAWKPEWGLQLTYQQREPGNGRVGSSFAGDDWITGLVTFNIPVWGRQSKAPALRAAQANRSAARSRSAAAARTAAAQYSSLRATRNAAEASVESLQQRIVAIHDRVAAQLAIYESGVGDYGPIIDGELAILRLRADIVAAEARAAAAAVTIDSLLVSP